MAEIWHRCVIAATGHMARTLDLGTNSCRAAIILQAFAIVEQSVSLELRRSIFAHRANDRPTAAASLILLSQHDCDDSLGDCGIGRVGRMHGRLSIEIIDLEHDHITKKIALDPTHPLAAPDGAHASSRAAAAPPHDGLMQYRSPTGEHVRARRQHGIAPHRRRLLARHDAVNNIRYRASEVVHTNYPEMIVIIP
jgi:hypothetical protein